jgi:hypothetical protein
VCCLLAICAGIGLEVRRRMRDDGRSILAVCLVVAGLAGLLLIEIVPRRLASGREVSACGLQDLEVRIASAPIAWQLATGGLRAEVRVPASAVSDIVGDRLRDSPFVDPRVSLADGSVQVDGLLDTPLGRAPVQTRLEVVVDDIGLAIAVADVLVAGREVPAELLSDSGIVGGLNGGGGASVCSASEGGSDVRVTGVEVDPDGFVLTVDVV